MLGPGETGAPARRAAALRRRMFCFLYEGVLLFGLVMFAGLLYALLTQQRHALVGQRGLQVWLFCVIGIYYVGFWTRQGQTLPMRTWRIRLVTASGKPLSALRASCRYVLAWLWFVPALLLLHLSAIKGTQAFGIALALGVLVYALLSFAHPQRQFLHDVLCGTRLVDATAT